MCEVRTKTQNDIQGGKIGTKNSNLKTMCEVRTKTQNHIQGGKIEITQ
jgi:hypothetical protein